MGLFVPAWKRWLGMLVALAVTLATVQLSVVEPRAWAADAPDGIGEHKAFTFEEQRLNDRLVVKVNPATGNLLVAATDLQIAGTGLDLSVRRFYNSLSGGSSSMGPGWLLDVGHDVHLQIDGDTVRFHAPSGYETVFTAAGGGEYTTEDHPGIDATLTRQDDGTFELEWKDKQVYRFDGDGRWTAHEDANGNTISFAYANKNAPVGQVTDTRGRTVDFTYGKKGRLASVTDNAGGRTYTYGYDNQGRLVSSAVTSYGLGKDNTNLKATTTFGYDGSDRLVAVTDPRGHTTQIGYQGTSRKVATVTRATGPTTTFSYLGSLDECADETDATTETVVDGPRTDVADVTTHCFDEHDRQIAAIDAKGHKRTSEYTSNSNVTSLNESGVAGGPAHAFTWQDDNLTQVQLPTGGTASMDYDDTQANPHLPTGVRDFATDDDAPPVWAYDYDDNGNMIEAHNPGEDITFRYCYHGDGTVDRIGQPPLDGLALDEDTDTSACTGHAQGNDTVFGYNTRGELTRIDPPGTRGTETFTYDALSRVQTRRDGRGVTETYTYDALDRVVRIDYREPASGGRDEPMASTQASTALIPPDDDDAKHVWITYSYDVNGNLTARADSNGNDTFSYDELNRMVKESPKAPSAVTTYSYDPAGNLTQIATSDQPAPVRYSYDETNLVVAVVDQKDRTTTFDYDDKGNRTQTAYPNGVVQASRYDDADRMDCTYAYTGDAPAGDDCPAASGDLLVFRDYAHERLGSDTNRLETETDRDNATTDYGYDAISRLTDATTVDSTDTTTRRHEYGYDDRGNLTREHVTGSQADDETRTQAYDVDNALCWAAQGDHDPDCATTPAGAETLSYDRAGNMTRRGDMALTYSLRGHTIEITPPGLATIEMEYTDATQDRRILAGDTRMGHNQTGLSAQGPNNGSTQIWFPRDPDGRLVGMLGAADDTGDVYYLFDRLGSVIATTNLAGQIAERYDYEPYGQQINPTDGDPNPWRYVAGYTDTTTGMIKFGMRYYMPDLTMWTQGDREVGGDSAAPMTLNAYNYVGSNPVNVVDETGSHGTCLWATIAVGAIVTAVGAVLTIASVGAGIGVAYGLYTFAFTSAVAIACEYGGAVD